MSGAAKKDYLSKLVKNGGIRGRGFEAVRRLLGRKKARHEPVGTPDQVNDALLRKVEDIVAALRCEPPEAPSPKLEDEPPPPNRKLVPCCYR